MLIKRFMRFVVCFVLLPSLVVSAQDYGLRFASHETVVEKRTTLDFGSKAMCFKGEVELAFDLKFRPEAEAYYGYLFRAFTSENLNIDLLYSPASGRAKFNLIVGDRLSRLKFSIDRPALFEWNTVRVIFNLDQDRVRIVTRDTTVFQDNVGLKKEDCLEFIFGRVQRNGFASNDVPPMVIKDLQILHNGTRLHHWPLNEVVGDVAHDAAGTMNGYVTRAAWVKGDRYHWKKATELGFDGPVSFAFNQKEEIVMVLSNDSLTMVHIPDGKIKSIQLNHRGNLISEGDQAAFFDETRQLINLNLDKRIVSVFDFPDQQWNAHRTNKIRLTRFWHHNKVINAADSTIVTLGGYGHLRYRNVIQRYDLKTGVWDTLRLTGDLFEPRYLSGLGDVSGKPVSYLIGGHGSPTGKQILHPQTYYDLYRIDWKKNIIEKIYELLPVEEPFVFANSIVVTEADSSYYALIFDHTRHKSSLKLIKGSLTEPVYQVMGDSILYEFHDTSSFADLYFAENSNFLVAATSNLDKSLNRSFVRVYTLGAPPYATQPAYYAEEKGGHFLYLFFATLLAIAAVFVFIRQRARTAPSVPVLHDDAGDEALVAEDEDSPVATVEANPKSAIYFFGGFRAFNKNAEEISNKFTPLLKELFLLIGLKSIGSGKGVTSRELDETLWFDKSEKSARNNRSVNIAKLKTILEEIGHFELSKTTGYWKIDFSKGDLYIDYAEYLAIIREKEKMNKDRINALTNIVSHGALLYNLDYAWLDDVKSSVCDEIVSVLLAHCGSIDISEDYEHALKVAKAVLIFDPVNEDAMLLKCRALSRKGKHALAKGAYEKFKKEYQLLYEEAYEKSFHEVVG